MCTKGCISGLCHHLAKMNRMGEKQECNIQGNWEHNNFCDDRKLGKVPTALHIKLEAGNTRVVAIDGMLMCAFLWSLRSQQNVGMAYKSALEGLLKIFRF